MEAIYLQSMTDFVLEQKYTTTLDISQIDFYDKEFNVLSKIRNYANFLKQPLKLGFFVTCDLEGVFLEKPTHFDEWYSELKRGYFNGYEGVIMESYLDAKSRVLFKNPIIWNDFNEMETLRIENNFFAWKKDEMEKFELNDISKNETIEHLVEYNLELSETAIKQIGL